MKTIFIQFLKLLSKADDAAAKMPWSAAVATGNPWIIGGKILMMLVGTAADLALLSMFVPTKVPKVVKNIGNKKGDWGRTEYKDMQDRRKKSAKEKLKQTMFEAKKWRGEIINGGETNGG